jgi:hypothetical protein
MQLHGMIQFGQAETGAKTSRFVPSETTVLTAFLPTNVVRIPKRSFPKTAKTLAVA